MTTQLIAVVLAVVGVLTVAAAVAWLTCPAWGLLAFGLFVLVGGLLLYDPRPKPVTEERKRGNPGGWAQ